MLLAMDAPDFDFTQRADVLRYVASMLIQLRTGYNLKGQLNAFGVVFARVGPDGNAVNQAVPIGSDGSSTQHLKSHMQQLANRSGAVGTVFARQDSFKLNGGRETTMVVVQLEHATIGDLVWYAQVHRDKRMDAFVGPFEYGSLDLDAKITRFLPKRWMS